MADRSSSQSPESDMKVISAHHLSMLSDTRRTPPDRATHKHMAGAPSAGDDRSAPTASSRPRAEPTAKAPALVGNGAARGHRAGTAAPSRPKHYDSQEIQLYIMSKR